MAERTHLNSAMDLPRLCGLYLVPQESQQRGLSRSSDTKGSCSQAVCDLIPEPWVQLRCDPKEQFICLRSWQEHLSSTYMCQQWMRLRKLQNH